MDSAAQPCIICNHTLDDGTKTVQLTQKGCDGINTACEKRKDVIFTIPGQLVHVECRKKYCNPNIIARDVKEQQQTNYSRSLRSKTEAFAFTENCLFCGQFAKCDGKKRGYDVYPVRTLDFQKTILNICSIREDAWAQKVSARIEFATDLPAVDAIYHQTCNVNFRTNRDIPKYFQPDVEKTPTRGRPTDQDACTAFMTVIEYLKENDNEQITITDLVDKMKEICGERAYSASYTKQRLVEHFGDSVIITEINGKQNVVTLRRTASSILHDFYSQCKSDNPESEKVKLIKTAAKLIKNDIKSVNTNRNVYPNSHDISSVVVNKQFIPDSLVQLLRDLFIEKGADTKVCSIGQAIMQASRPRVIIAPLQLGLAVQLHHHFASKYLIDVLNSLGFCVSYSEVQMFESCAAVSNRADIENFQNDMFIQYVADNVDHNLRTLDGHNTFHGMGMIACVTPGNFSNKPIMRKVISSDDLISSGRIDISFYRRPETAKLLVSLSDLTTFTVSDNSIKLNFLAQVTWPLRKPGPEWSGLMQMVRKGDYPGKSSVVFLPMIDMDPGDMSCIYTTLNYISSHASKYRQTAIVTFDQPLYWKAVTVISSENDNSSIKDIVLRMGGFHCIMSYLGCIGQLMSGSGLNDLLETVYAPNVIPHIVNGKAVARAVRGHSLATNAVNILLIRQCSEISQPVDANNNNEKDEETGVERNNSTMNEFVDMYTKLSSGEITVEDVYKNDLLDDFYNSWLITKRRLLQYPTAALWIQYLEMVDILRKFITAERTGDWELSLQSLKEMLPFFAAAGHNLYLKSVYFYLQCMQTLQESNPDVYQAFMNGYHVVRRSDRYWAGLSPDLVIEQALMRSVKTTGGMTRGKGLSESQRAQWLLSMPSCVEINNAMQLFSGKEFQTSPQHKELGKSRNERDFKDTQTFLSFLEERNPFREDPLLFNIETGVTTDSKVNAHHAKVVGNKVVESMIGQNVFELTFKKSQKAVTLDESQQIKVDNDTIKVDPQLLFQRLSAAAQRFVEDMPTVFSYELCSVPSSLFDTTGLIRKSQKSLLADAIWALGDCSVVEILETNKYTYVVDGGSLLHHVPWKTGMLFSEICDAYIHYISSKYLNAVIVFDGYQSGPTTKDTAHVRRNHGVTSTKVYFTKSTPLATRKEKFLSNPENKQNFIFMLGNELEEKGYGVVYADSDADVLIVKSAIDLAITSDVAIIGEDTDILVLLLYYINSDHKHVIFKSALKQRTSKSQRVWDINKTKNVLGQTQCRMLPVIHALTGCDTTSQLFGIGKGSALKKFKSDERLSALVDVFLAQSNKDDIICCGEQILVILYGGLPLEGLDLLRFRKFTTKVMSSSTHMQVQTLPPTSAAAKYHSLRVYYQVHEWIDSETSLFPTEWGWALTNNMLMPLKTDLKAAPDNLLNMIRCKCKQNCDSRKCTCRKNGLECSSGCAECRGLSCTNVAKFTDLDSDSDSD